MPLRITPLTDPDRGPGSYRLAWLAADGDDVPVGSAFLRVYTSPGLEHLAELSIQVHPTERRNGIGSRLVDVIATAAREIGRRSVITAHVTIDSPGDLFLTALGLRRVLTLTFVRLPLAEADLAALSALVEQPHPGYRLASWSGTVPDDLAESFADSRRAMNDMPMDEIDYGVDAWDVDRVRAAALAIEKRGDLLDTVVALDRTTGSIVGFTELVIPGDGTGDGLHYGTGVLPEHRGHGLARWMKAESIRLARHRHPALGGLLADTADSNRHMRAINDALGYRPTHQSAVYQLDL